MSYPRTKASLHITSSTHYAAQPERSELSVFCLQLSMEKNGVAELAPTITTTRKFT